MEDHGLSTKTLSDRKRNKGRGSENSVGETVEANHGHGVDAGDAGAVHGAWTRVCSEKYIHRYPGTLGRGNDYQMVRYGLG